MKHSIYTTLFLDVGGVFLTNGWDRHLREKTAKKFQIDYEEMNSRHALTFDTYEIGKITIEEYLKRVVFYEPRPFSMEDFKEYIFSHSQPYSQMIDLIKTLKHEYALRTIIVSNEGRELAVHRINRFHLKEFIDIFVCSGFVGMRKPDLGIYQIALDIAQVESKEVIYIDDRPMLVEIGRELGMEAVLHTTLEQTEACLKKLLSVNTQERTKGHVRSPSETARE